jgi:ASC-1-like (ASCH) protein
MPLLSTEIINARKLKLHLQEIFEKVKDISKYDHLSYLLQKEPIAPVHEEEMNNIDLVKKREGGYTSLSEKFKGTSKNTFHAMRQVST